MGRDIFDDKRKSEALVRNMCIWYIHAAKRIWTNCKHREDCEPDGPHWRDWHA
ncbi:hypothetical protein BO71DRAFT_399764 [Aspergillus ellipticus CBS 707.79]|uniref:Uncharacterized protein n=1 Tax=Aspergillus ellipticus CBS 707.79 TaxID=1448320 RepID=A0A319D7C1_9EURO|nr:hypothetical protein BO71DRAFT_399764 [Aspergillus ellipticus CBS 707.79]